jgi:uncharacterized protein
VVSLLDVNVLVALLVPEHEHHRLSVEWFSREAVTEGWSTCAVTELGVIRVCAQLAGGRMTPELTADRLLMLTISNRSHRWWPDLASPALLSEVRTAVTAKHVTDGYLLGLARRHGGRLATFDRALATAGGVDTTCLLPR